MLVDGVRAGRVERPATAAEAAAAVRRAHAAGEAVVPVGGGTHLGLGNPPTRLDVALDTRGLAAIRAHAPADLTLTVEAGATLAAVQRALAPHGQFLPLEAEDPERATIGGLIAAGVAGPLRLGHGTIRDRLLWTEVVGADGTLTQGGARVVKSVAGYDLPKLHVGAVGALGVVTAACFKLQPLPAARRLVAIGADEPDALAPVIRALADGRLQPALATAVQAPAFADPWTLAVGADGPAETTAWQAEQLLTLARAHGLGAALLPADEAAAARQALMAGRALGDVRMRLVVLPDRVPALLDWLAGAGALAVHAEVGNGVVRAAWDAGRGETAWRDAEAIVETLGGHWILEACPPSWKAYGLDVWGPPRPDRALMKRLKQALDPAGTLSPGRSIGG